jgi:hypothetical protein
MATKDSIALEFGALAPPLLDQLTQAGHGAVAVETVRHWQKDANALCRLRIRCLITESAARNGQRKLGRQIANALLAERDRRG